MATTSSTINRTIAWLARRGARPLQLYWYCNITILEYT